METVVVTRHKEYVTHLINLGLIEAEVEVVKHASPEMISGKHVITSGLPLHLAALAAKLTTVGLFVPSELRGVELTLEQVEQFAQPVASYIVKAV